MIMFLHHNRIGTKLFSICHMWPCCPNSDVQNFLHAGQETLRVGETGQCWPSSFLNSKLSCGAVVWAVSTWITAPWQNCLQSEESAAQASSWHTTCPLECCEESVLEAYLLPVRKTFSIDHQLSKKYLPWQMVLLHMDNMPNPSKLLFPSEWF